ncbi:MAG: hypothetical protein ACK5LO_15760 [Leucobacter sp.]
MSSQQRSYGPAIAMIAGIALAAVLAVLATFNMTGDWTAHTAPEDRLERTISEMQVNAAATHADRIDPATMTLLEEVSPNRYAFAARSNDGGLVAGIVGDGGSGFASAEPGEKEIGVGLWNLDTPYYWLRVRSLDSGVRPYAYELRAFETEEEFEAYAATQQ